ncbi:MULTISPECIES: hypothetical protein [Bacilli]|uniref:hypothetical protein n=1 Tax=Bacilli TaxID=91061 RepID=UPI0019680DEE|nr:hypothetical protein [Lysinibacillus fusiformis]QSB07878.1 hypothetical protein JTI58_12490 [Lysinibacillus fusiformis]
MTNLKIEDIQLVREYLALLETVEEGLAYVVASYSDLMKTESDTVLMDVLLAFSSIIQTNQVFESIFEQEGAIVNLVRDFSNVTNSAFQLEENLLDRNIKFRIAKDNITPLFNAWKKEAQVVLGPLVAQ